MKGKILLALMVTFILGAWTLGDESADATTYFSRFMQRNDIEKVCMRSVPTLDQCSQLFNTDSSAQTFHQFVTDMVSKYKEGTGATNETFAEVRVTSFTTADMKAGKGNYAGGMARIADRLKDGITFYEVEYLRTRGAEAGMAYKYWVHLGNQWLFLPKPWRAFR